MVFVDNLADNSEANKTVNPQKVHPEGDNSEVDTGSNRSEIENSEVDNPTANVNPDKTKHSVASRGRA